VRATLALHPPAPHRARLDRAEDHVLDHQADDDHGEQAGEDVGGVEQVAVLELGKDIVRTTLPIVKAKSGKEITYQDDEARKSAGAGKP